MEVHNHSHTPRKKWTHYFWEFLMLFLAVFAGFLAENFREHLIEHRKENNFVRSLLEDLKKDTASLNYSIRRITGNIRSADSLNFLFEKGNKEKDYELRMSRFGQNAGHSVDIVFNDRTSSQLKGTGSMRLIRKKVVADSIAQYWNNQIKIAQIHDRYEAFRMEQRKMGWKTFSWYRDSSLNNDRIINEQMLSEFVSCTTSLYTSGIWQFLPELQKELALAKNLILLIGEEYHMQ